jgi:hypothetical protein
MSRVSTPFRDGQLEFEGARAADDLPVLPGGVHAVGREDSDETAGTFLRGLAAEVVKDRPESAEHVFATPAPDFDAHIFSSGA